MGSTDPAPRKTRTIKTKDLTPGPFNANWAVKYYRLAGSPDLARLRRLRILVNPMRPPIRLPGGHWDKLYVPRYGRIDIVGDATIGELRGSLHRLRVKGNLTIRHIDVPAWLRLEATGDITLQEPAEIESAKCKVLTATKPLTIRQSCRVARLFAHAGLTLGYEGGDYTFADDFMVATHCEVGGQLQLIGALDADAVRAMEIDAPAGEITCDDLVASNLLVHALESHTSTYVSGIATINDQLTSRGDCFAGALAAGHVIAERIETQRELWVSGGSLIATDVKAGGIRVAGNILVDGPIVAEGYVLAGQHLDGPEESRIECTTLDIANPRRTKIIERSRPPLPTDRQRPLHVD